MSQTISPSEVIPYERLWAGKSRFKAILAMAHPMAVILFSSLTLILAGLAGSNLSDLPTTIPLVLAMAAIQASNGIYNEICDQDLDALNKPWRALPAGWITPAQALFLAMSLLCLGLLLAFQLSLTSTILLFCGAGMGYIYSARLKRTAWSWIPYLVAYPSLPVWVSISLGKFQPEILTIYVLAAPFVVAIHLCNQLRDYDEEEPLGIRSLVQNLGWPGAVRLCNVLLALSPFPFLFYEMVMGRAGRLLGLPLVFVLHWALTSLYLWKNRHTLSPDHFRSLFRRSQITGPGMLIVWFWLAQSVS